MAKVLLVIATAIGLYFSYIDHRPNFDDVWGLAFGVTATCAVFGFIEPRYPVRWALAIGVWIPLINITTGGGFPSLLFLVFAFAGAYFGRGFRLSLAG